jgi:hypothetical protein
VSHILEPTNYPAAAVQSIYIYNYIINIIVQQYILLLFLFSKERRERTELFLLGL